MAKKTQVPKGSPKPQKGGTSKRSASIGDSKGSMAGIRKAAEIPPKKKDTGSK